MTKILITGAGGFIASHVADHLVRKGHRVLGIDNFSTGKRENPTEKFDLVQCDITDWFGYLGEFKDFEPDVVVHMAAQSAISVGRNFPAKDAHNNVTGTMNTIMACKKLGVKRIIFSSTSAVYLEYYSELPLIEECPLQPNTIYGISKLAAESYIKLLLPDSIILRFANVFGPRQIPIGGNQVIPLMITHLLGKNPDFTIFGDGEQVRDFIYVEDVVGAVEKSLDGEADVYNICHGMSWSVNMVANHLAIIHGNPNYEWRHNDIQDKRNVAMSNSKAREKLHWEPTTYMPQALERTYQWWKNL